MNTSPLQDTLTRALGDGYTIERELGGGGMARVFVAEERGLGRRVVLKVLPPEAAGAISVERFKREVQLAARLQHPHIVPLLAAGEADGILYYSMPFIEGESLRARIAREHELPVPVVTRILREVAGALAYAHARNVVHRDIKPDNILLADGHAVVADFGIAKAIATARLTSGDRADTEGLTQFGVALGTPAYMSPEQAAADPHVDHRADIYALGAVGYELLTGRPPFAGHSPQALLAAVIGATPTGIAAERSSVPAALDQLIMRCLEKRPADRPQSAGEVLQVLDAQITPTGMQPSGAQSRGARQGYRIAVAVIVLAALGGGALYAARRPVVAQAASTIAVMPFVPVSPDTALARLGRDLVVTLSANLDGVGAIRATDPLTTLGLTSADAGLASLADAAALATRLGSRSFVYGTSMREGGRVRLDFGLYPSSGEAPLARGSVLAHQDSLSVLSDSLTWSLLRQIWRRDLPPAPNVAAITTKSMPALRAYLEGEHARADGRYMDAISAFDRSIEADSTFWLAYWRNSSTRAWIFHPADTVLRRYLQHLEKLPERDRALILAGDTPGIAARIAAYRRVAERFPDYWPAWLGAGDVAFHDGPPAGIPLDQAREDLLRVVALNPRWSEAWQHLMYIAMALDGIASSAADSTMRVLGGLGYDSASVQAFGVRELRSWRFVAAALKDSSVVDSALGDSVIAEVSRVRGAQLVLDIFPVFPMSVPGGARVQLALGERVLAANVQGPVRVSYRAGMEWAWAARGAFDVALPLVERRASEGRDAVPALDLLRMASVAEWTGAVPGAMERAWTTAARDADRMAPAARAEATWLRGVLAASRGDTTLFRSTGDELRSLASTSGLASVRDYRRSLDAFGLDLRGNRAAAADSLTALEWEIAERGDSHFGIALSRLTASRWLQAMGRSAEASRLLVWHEGVGLHRDFYAAKHLTESLVVLERARLAESMGEAADASRFYREFLERFDRPMPVHEPLVAEARAAIARLSRSTG
ncbi:MAG: serine/threonine-protein kinase [Gemmatimonadaceae bacterium]